MSWGTRKSARSRSARRCATEAIPSTTSAIYPPYAGSIFSRLAKLFGSPFCVSKVPKKPSISARRAAGLAASHPAAKSALFRPVAVFHSALMRLQARRALTGNSPSVQASATQSAPASNGMSSIRRTGAVRSPCQSGWYHVSRYPAHFISQPRTASAPLRRLISATASRTIGSPLSRSSARTSRLRRSRSRSSIGWLPGRICASLGNAASRYWAKAWMVSILSPPPGQSRTRANSDRARERVSGSVGEPRLASSSASTSSGRRTHRARTSLTRTAISAAPALVKVRHRICEGSAPGSSNRRRTRAESTCVLPVPALAESQTLSRGSTASR